MTPNSPKLVESWKRFKCHYFREFFRIASASGSGIVFPVLCFGPPVAEARRRVPVAVLP